MTTEPDCGPSARTRKPWTAEFWGPVLLVLATGAVYSNSLHGPFVFDDIAAILGNSSIRSLRPLTAALSPPRNTTVEGRPLVNLSLAVNYAIGGTDVLGYHLVNIFIHGIAALILFGLVRRTLFTPRLHSHFAGSETQFSLAVAFLWALHPLQTESVTYVIQRAESLVAVAYLLTLYALVRGASSPAPARWYALCILCCGLGMVTKEVMATAPLIAVLYDRVFLVDSWNAVQRKRGRLHATLATTWIVLGYLVWQSDGRTGTVGLDRGVSPPAYAATQAVMVTHYLRLAIWPDPLVFDYGYALISDVLQVLGCAAFLAVLMAFTAWAYFRGWAAAFPAICFFHILAPTSSFVPVVTQTAAEHRMYLPLAGLCALAVAAADWSLTHAVAQRLLPQRLASQIALVGLALSAVALGGRTYARNQDYQSRRALLQATVNDCPDNPRARSYLARESILAGDFDSFRALSPAVSHMDMEPVQISILPIDEHGRHQLEGKAILDMFDGRHVSLRLDDTIPTAYFDMVLAAPDQSFSKQMRVSVRQFDVEGSYYRVEGELVQRP